MGSPEHVCDWCGSDVGLVVRGVPCPGCGRSPQLRPEARALAALARREAEDADARGRDTTGGALPEAARQVRLSALALLAWCEPGASRVMVLAADPHAAVEDRIRAAMGSLQQRRHLLHALTSRRAA